MFEKLTAAENALHPKRWRRVASQYRRANTCSRREEGQSVLEFALMIPFLTGFILFVVDCGLIAYSSVSMTNAVREGARCAAVGGNSSAVAARVNSSSGGLANAVTVDNPVYTPSTAAVGGTVDVRATYRYEWITPIGLIPSINQYTVFSKHTVMRMETSSTNRTSCP